MRKVFWALLLVAALLVPATGFTKALNQVWRMGTSGPMPAWGPVNLASANAITGIIPRGNLPSAGLTSGTVGSGSTTSTSFTQMVTVTMTVTGNRPVFIASMPDLPTDTAGISVNTVATCSFQWQRDAGTGGALTLGTFQLINPGSASLGYGPNFMVFDTGVGLTAGSHTWTFFTKRVSGAASLTCGWNLIKLTAFEL